MSFIPSSEEWVSAVEGHLMKFLGVPAEDVKVTSVDYRFNHYMDEVTINVSVRLPWELNIINVTISKTEDE